MIKSTEDARVYLRTIVNVHLSANARRYEHSAYNGEPKYGSMMGFQFDLSPQTGKVIDMNDDWVVLKTARSKFFLCAKDLLTNIPNIDDTITITPYARMRFDGRRLDAPDETVHKDGYVTQSFTLGQDKSFLPIEKSTLRCPELKELINQVEKLPSPDGQRTLAQVFIDNGAGPEVAFNDPKPSHIISSPPALTFKVNNTKLTGDLTISYDRGMDLYEVNFSENKEHKTTGDIKVDNIDFTSLAKVVHDLIDDGQWKIAAIEMVKPAPRKRAGP